MAPNPPGPILRFSSNSPRMYEATFELSPTDFRSQLASLDEAMRLRKHVVFGSLIHRLRRRYRRSWHYRYWQPLTDWWYLHVRYGPRFVDEQAKRIAAEVDRRILEELCQSNTGQSSGKSK